MYYRRFAIMSGFDRTVKASANVRDTGKLVSLDSNKVGPAQPGADQRSYGMATL
jgi:hypothetical protein